MPGTKPSIGNASFEFGNFLAKNASKALIALILLVIVASGGAAAEFSDTLIGTSGSEASGDTGP